MAFVESTCSQGTYYPATYRKPLDNALFIIYGRKEGYKKNQREQVCVYIEIKH